MGSLCGRRTHQGAPGGHCCGPLSCDEDPPREDAGRPTCSPTQLPKTTRDELKGLRWLLVRNYAELDTEERQKLQRAFEIWPELATLHGLKEEFRAFYEHKNQRTAIRALETWIAQVQQTGTRPC